MRHPMDQSANEGGFFFFFFAVVPSFVGIFVRKWGGGPGPCGNSSWRSFLLCSLEGGCFVGLIPEGRFYDSIAVLLWRAISLGSIS